jgi:IPTL-CTERM motif
MWEDGMTKYRHFISCTLVLLCLTMAPVIFPENVKAAPGRGALYGTDPGNLIIIDTLTGIGNFVGNLGGPGFPGFAIDTSNRIAYGGQGTGAGVISVIDLNTGQTSLLGNMNLGFAVASALDFRDDGVLFASVNIVGDGGSGGDHLAIINTATGAATIIGSYGICTGVTIPSLGHGSCTIDGIEAIAFDNDGNLWGSLRTSPSSAGTPGLYRINQNTGRATFVTPILDSNGQPPPRGGVVSLQFACDGTLYGGTAPSSPQSTDGGFLVTIDPETGVFAYVGNTSASSEGGALADLSFDAGCASAVPTLSEWGMVAMAGILGMAGFIVMRRKRVHA